MEDTAPPYAVATRSAGRGTREAGSTRVGDATTALMDDRAAHPATGSHLPSEATAPPFAFASSPFAHPIPQSRRRASGDLFSGSLSGRPRNSVISGQFIPDHNTSDCLPGHITLTL
ncbi:MAG TPA: hypothetical protein VL380_08325 [Nitrosospira sp.]|nr:hypothetical protein [Nitrosospira sp.]